jgi:hypothetical protein
MKFSYRIIFNDIYFFFYFDILSSQILASANADIKMYTFFSMALTDACPFCHPFFRKIKAGLYRDFLHHGK